MKRNEYSSAESGLHLTTKTNKPKVLMIASVASMIDQFNLPNIRLMQEMGCQVHVACNFKEGNTCDQARIHKLVQMLQKMHVSCCQWNCPRQAAAPKQCLDAYVQLCRLMKQHAYAWVHCHSPIGAALARAAAHRYGIRVIYTAHGFHFYHGAPFKNWLFYYPAESLLSHWTDVLITVNMEDYRFAVRKLHAGRTVHIPGVGINVKKFASCISTWHGMQDGESITKQKLCQKQKDAVRKAYGIPKKAVLLLSVGELSKRKNHEEVIAALAGMQRQDVYYLICGQGRRAGFLAAYAKRLGVGKFVRFSGYQEDVKRLYQASDIFVFPSKQEGMPVALMEAMASGMACVVSDIRGNRELIAGPCMTCSRGAVCCGGIRYPLGHTFRLQEALEVMIADGKLRERCGKYNRGRIAAYSQETVCARMRVIYQEMVNDRIHEGKLCRKLQ